MSTWHKTEDTNEEGAYCGTAHCRAGWVVALAGKAGRELELLTSPSFAAQMIYKHSSNIHVSPFEFFLTNEQAMENITKCANEEVELSKSK
ncbi:MAG: hypothetical protein ACRCYO_13450 [Bacteroidia bacterium]